MATRCVFLALIALVFLPAPSHAAIALSGGDPGLQKQINTLYNSLPACCKTSEDVPVCLCDSQNMNADLESCAAAASCRITDPGAIAGLYQNNPPTITLRLSSNTPEFMATFAHEYGHFVWFNVLTPSQKQQFQAIYQKQSNAHHLVSRYASVSVLEGFAESFSYDICANQTLKQRDPLTYAFLKNIFRGVVSYK